MVSRIRRKAHLSYGWYFYVTWLPTYLREGRHQEITSTALLSILPLFCGGLANPVSVALGSFMVKRTGDLARTRRVIACIGFAGAAAFLVLSTWVGNPVLAMLAIGLASFFNDLVMPGAWATAMDIGGKHAGTVSGAMNMWGNVGGALGPLMISYILKWTHNDWNLTFYVSAAVYLMGVVCWAFLDPVTPIEKEEGASTAAAHR